MSDEDAVYGFGADDASQLIDSLSPNVQGTPRPSPQRQVKAALVRVTATAMSGSTPGTGTGRLMRLDQVGTSSTWVVSELEPTVDVDVLSYRSTALSDEVVLVVREQLTNELIVC